MMHDGHEGLDISWIRVVIKEDLKPA